MNDHQELVELVISPCNLTIGIIHCSRHLCSHCDFHASIWNVFCLTSCGRNLNVTIFWGGLSVCLKQGYPHLPLKTFVLLFSYLCLDSIVIHFKKNNLNFYGFHFRRWTHSNNAGRLIITFFFFKNPPFSHVLVYSHASVIVFTRASFPFPSSFVFGLFIRSNTLQEMHGR